jgi:hypothetical protein
VHLLAACIKPAAVSCMLKPDQPPNLTVNQQKDLHAGLQKHSKPLPTTPIYQLGV